MFNHVEVFRGSIFPQPKAQGFRDPDRVYRPGLVSIDRGNVPGRDQRFRMPAEYDPRSSSPAVPLGKTNALTKHQASRSECIYGKRKNYSYSRRSKASHPKVQDDALLCDTLLRENIARCCERQLDIRFARKVRSVFSISTSSHSFLSSQSGDVTTVMSRRTNMKPQWKIRLIRL
jgi:hypothetical protein